MVSGQSAIDGCPAGADSTGARAVHRPLRLTDHCARRHRGTCFGGLAANKDGRERLDTVLRRSHLAFCGAVRSRSAWWGLCGVRVVLLFVLLLGSSSVRAQANTVADEILYIVRPARDLVPNCVAAEEDCNGALIVNLYYSPAQGPVRINLPGSLGELPTALASFVYGTNSIQPGSCDLSILERTADEWKAYSENSGDGLFAAGVPHSLRHCFSGGIRELSDRPILLLWLHGRVLGWALCDPGSCQLTIRDVWSSSVSGRTVNLRISLLARELLGPTVRELGTVVTKITDQVSLRRPGLRLVEGHVSNLAGADDEADSMLNTIAP